MKVTISFDGTKIVVPCGDGDITVKELTSLAVTRYKKAIGKAGSGTGGNDDFWVSVSSLKSHEGGMLDTDDLIGDVCDDREQIMAIFEERRGGHLGGDGMSASSSLSSDSDKELLLGVGSTDPASGSKGLGEISTATKNSIASVEVRRGSESNLVRVDDQVGVGANNGCQLVTAEKKKMSSATAGISRSNHVQAVVASINALNDAQQHHNFIKSRSKTSIAGSVADFQWNAGVGRDGRNSSNKHASADDNFNNLRSNSLRMTMVNGGDVGDVAPTSHHYTNSTTDDDNLDSLTDHVNCFESKTSLNVLRRREPLGASANKPDRSKSPHREKPPPPAFPIPIESSYFDVLIVNEIGPLGIHVVPCDADGRLVVQGIEPGGRVDRDGRLAVGDEIIRINGCPLADTTFEKAQEIFKDAKLYAKELRLRVVKGPVVFSGGDVVDPEEVCLTGPETSNSLSSSFKPEELAAGTKITTAVHANNTRKIGKILSISLKKGPIGLGFSITTRDNALSGNTPIYIKNILPKGAAIEDGNLKTGDRLLEVNGVCVDGMNQSDVVSLLRNAPLDSEIKLIVSRHDPTSGSTHSRHPSETASSSRDDEKHHQSSSTGSVKAASSPNKKPEPSAITDKKKENIDPDVGGSAVVDPSTLPSSEIMPESEHYEDLPLEEFQFPWKQRQILTFDIPVHDSERAGLGVSVKGKTSSGKDGVVDLGIFVKSVLHGGAASRDGRLKTNDQLVNINGLSLLGKANPEAMETLRKAMHEEGPLPGVISLTVARRQELHSAGAQPQLSGGPKRSVGGERRDSLSSFITSSDDDMIREYKVSSNGQMDFKIPSSLPLGGNLKTTRNPVIDRLMGKDGSQQGSAGVVPQNLRNESYYMATHQDTFSSGSNLMLRHQQEQALMNGEESRTAGERDARSPKPTTSEDFEVTTESLTSLLEAKPFARDMPGRQSMSEKRHATLDAKNTDTYQKRKKAREEREMLQQRMMWKKSASLESLHMICGSTIGQPECNRLAAGGGQDRSPYVRANSVRVSRNRGCNESFRAAVDRSYENEKDFPENPNPTIGDQNPADNHVDFVIQDLSPGGGDDDENCISAANYANVVVRRRPKNPETKDRKTNRNSRLLTGLSNMFSKSKNKPPPPPPPTSASSDSSSRRKTLNRKSLPAPVPPTDTAPLSSESRMLSTNVPSSKSEQQLHGILKPSRSRENTEDQRRHHQQQFDHQRHIHQWNQMQMHHHHRQQQHRSDDSHLHHSRSQQEPQRPPPVMREYFPSAMMMRPGSRVGIVADPVEDELSASDYDVLQRLQTGQTSHRPPPPPPPTHPTLHQGYMYTTKQQQQHINSGVQHSRSGSNLSNSSSNSNNKKSSVTSLGKPARRPKSNFYEYELYNNYNNNSPPGVSNKYVVPPPPPPTAFRNNQQSTTIVGNSAPEHRHPSSTAYSLPRNNSASSTTQANRLHQHHYFQADYD